MPTSLRIIFLTIVLGLARFPTLGASLEVALGQALDPIHQDLALVGGTIIVSPADEAIRDGVLLIRGGRITAVGARARLQVPRT